MITSNFAHTDTSYIFIQVVLYPITSPLISHELPVDIVVQPSTNTVYSEPPTHRCHGGVAEGVGPLLHHGGQRSHTVGR